MKQQLLILNKDDDGHLKWLSQTKKSNIEIEGKKILKTIKECEQRISSLGETSGDSVSITKELSNALTDLNPALTAGVAETGDFAKAQEKLASNVEVSKKAITRWKGAVNEIKGTLKSVGGSLIQFLANLAISAVLTYATNKFHEASQKMEEAAERAKKVTEQSEELADTKQQVIELKSKLDDVNTTESEAVSIRQQLYDIQEDLIEQYGAEASKIDLVRDSVNSLNTAFQSLDASALKDWYLDDPESAKDAVESIYGESSVNDWGVNTGNESLFISPHTNRTDVNSIHSLFTELIGSENWSTGSQNMYNLDIGNYIKSNGGTKKDLIDKYDEILNGLEKILVHAQNDGRDDAAIASLENIISDISKAKNYWADEKYDEQFATANEYAKYLVSQNTEQNRAYTALQKAKIDYDNAVVSGNEEEIAQTYKNYKLATETIQNIVDGLDKTGNEGAVRDFLSTTIKDAIDSVSKEDFVIKFKANENDIKTSLQKVIDSFGSGKSVNAVDIINYNPYASSNKGTLKTNAFYDIKNMADEAGVSLERYVDWLVEVGIVQGELSDDSKNLDFTPILNMNSEAMKKLTKEIDNFQSSFDTIKDVFADYNTTGALSIDNLQKLLALDSEYLKLLFDENGNLTLNKQAYEDLAKAKLEIIKLDVLRNAIEKIKSITDEADAQKYLAEQTKETAEATGEFTEELLKQYAVGAKLKGGSIEKAVMGIYEETENFLKLIDSVDKSFDGNTESVNEHIKALEDEKKQQEIVKKSLEVQKSALEELSKEYEDAQGKINSLVDLTVDMLKQKYEDEKEIIEKQKDAYKDKVDTLKEALDEEKDAYDKHQSILEKTNDISTLQRQALSLQGNTSVEGKQRLAEIQKELAESTQDLYDTQYENSVNERQDALDKEYERKEQLWDKEIERIDEVVSNERQLRIEAMNLIDTRSDKFYNDLWDYVYEYTTKSRFEFDTLWTEAYDALDEYNFGQLTCLQIMDFLEQGVYNTGLQIDIFAGQISGVSSAIDSITVSIENLKKSLENLPPTIDPTGNKTTSDDTSNGGDGLEGVTGIDLWEKDDSSTDKVQNEGFSILPNEIDFENNVEDLIDWGNQQNPNKTVKMYSVLLGGGKHYSAIGKSTSEAAKSIWEKWHKDYKLGKTDRTVYSIQDIKDAILEQSPEYNQFTNAFSPNIKTRKDFLNGYYAKGTLSAKGGLSIVDEEGSELILSQPQKGRYANLGEGSVVFTKDQTKNLWELSKLSDPPKKLIDAYNKFKDMYVKNGNNFFVNKSNESYLSGIRGNSSITTNSVTNSNNRSITAPINITVHNANGLNEKKLATNIKTEIFREFRKYSSWLG